MRIFYLRRFIALAIAIVLSRILFWAWPALHNAKLVSTLWIAFIIFASYQIASSKVLTLHQTFGALLQFSNGVVASFGLSLLAMSFLLPRLANIVFEDATFASLMPNTNTIPWLKIFIITLCTGITEETALRGYLQDFLSGLRSPLWLILIVQGLLFSAFHTEFFKASLGNITYFALVGVFFSIVVFYFKNLYWAIGFHFFWNFAQAIFFGSRVVGTGRYLTEMPPKIGGVGYLYIVVDIFCIVAIVYLYRKIKLRQETTTALPT